MQVDVADAVKRIEEIDKLLLDNPYNSDELLDERLELEHLIALAWFAVMASS